MKDLQDNKAPTAAEVQPEAVPATVGTGCCAAPPDGGHAGPADWVKGWIEDYVKAKIEAVVNPAEIQGILDDLVMQVTAVLAAAVAELDTEALAVYIADKTKAMLLATPGPASTGGHAAPAFPNLYLRRVRRELAREYSRGQGVTMATARERVGKLTNEQILKATDEAGIDRGAIGDGTILAWLKEHWPDILRVVVSLLPLLMML